MVAGILPRLRPPVNGEEAAVEAVPGMMPPGAAGAAVGAVPSVMPPGAAVGAVLPNANPDPPNDEVKKSISLNINTLLIKYFTLASK